ncbi:MAG: hypothetical protein K0R83_3063 [Caulobacter sp.]|nr:hypothetical protein [Caulobacter sp.]
MTLATGSDPSPKRLGVRGTSWLEKVMQGQWCGQPAKRSMCLRMKSGPMRRAISSGKL